MKSNVMRDRYIIECSCKSPLCMLVFDYDDEFEFIDVSFQYNKYLSFWGRIKAALKFIFMRNDMYWQGVIIHSEHVKQLEELVKKIKKRGKMNEKKTIEM